MLVGIPVVSVMFPMLFFGAELSKSVDCWGNNWIPSIVFTSIFWMGDRHITIWYRKKFQRNDEYVKRLYYSGTTIVLYTAGMSFILFSCEPMFDHSALSLTQHPGYPKALAASLVPTIVITAIYEAAFFLDRWKESIAESERLKKENTISQLEALRNQVNPHFLFNSLNTLVSIIPEDPQKGVEFVRKLSLVYRCILDLRDRQVITAKEELECLGNYIFLLESRFGDNIRFEFDVKQEDMRKFLVPLSLQMLVENAVKHNVVSHKRPLHVRITSGVDCLIVQNNLQRKTSGVEVNGMGLHNINERCRLTFHRGITVEEDEHNYSVSIPLVNIEEYQHKS
ncbi:MAG: hypothetical protein RL220_1019 [Bacteroidota bacterium]